MHKSGKCNAALRTLHLLYVHLCAVGGAVVTDYIDVATGEMVETPDDGGQPTATVSAEPVQSTH